MFFGCHPARCGVWVSGAYGARSDVCSDAPKVCSENPIDVARSLNGLDPETTMVIVVSKTFTTAETMLNARTVRKWITSVSAPPTPL
eukprot:8890090-Pyramimonas_sp.AAC.2